MKGNSDKSKLHVAVHRRVQSKFPAIICQRGPGERCWKHGVNLGDAFATLQAYLGSRYVNDFNRFGRTWQVIVQADLKDRNDSEDVKRLSVRNASGQMVPQIIANVEMTSSPLVLSRYNMVLLPPSLAAQSSRALAWDMA